MTTLYIFLFCAFSIALGYYGGMFVAWLNKKAGDKTENEASEIKKETFDESEIYDDVPTLDRWNTRVRSLRNFH